MNESLGATNKDKQEEACSQRQCKGLAFPKIIIIQESIIYNSQDLVIIDLDF